MPKPLGDFIVAWGDTMTWSKFWTISSMEEAERSLSGARWAMTVICALLVMSQLTMPSTGRLVLVGALIVFTVVFWQLVNTALAAVALVFIALGMVGCLAATIALLLQGNAFFAIGFFMLLVWGALTGVACRGVLAARYLGRARRQIPSEQVFD